jgi:hypothetical protein
MCVSIDCECDKGPKWLCRRPLGFEGVYEGIFHRLHPLFARYGAKPTYLLSPEVMRDEASVEGLRRLRGAELGTHLHGEFAEPQAFEPDVTRVFQRDYPPELERQKLSSMTDLFVAAFDRRPTSFRAGRFGIGDRSLELLAELGYTVDSSVTPNVDWASAGAVGLDFRGAPTQPYRPNPRAPAHRGDGALLEIPVTIRPRRAARIPFLGPLLEPRWLRPTKTSAEELVAIAAEEIEECRKGGRTQPVVLNVMFHNVEVVANASPYADTDRDAQAILGRLEGLLHFGAREGFSFVGLSDVAELVS